MASEFGLDFEAGYGRCLEGELVADILVERIARARQVEAADVTPVILTIV
jgi:hypothetical protein